MRQRFVCPIPRTLPVDLLLLSIFRGSHPIARVLKDR